MKAKTWNQVKDILSQALEIEPDGRRAFLAKVSATPEIVAEVESLLAFEGAAADLMDAPAIAFAQAFLDDDGPDNALLGQHIGVYKIIGELGHGGMGAVYLAERDDGKFEQRVALKLLKRELNTSSLRQRFEQERQILASLDHPNIARLLDAGTTDDGIPYFAMEYIEGLPIDVFCQQNDLSLDERLDLFREVCSAVNFAHRNLVVHRDLKPSNILVNHDRMPKLLDFGISKIISDEFQQTATITKLGAMTPSYASPEQLQNKATSTATDIYSLGVVLYELLSGHRPFESREHDLKEIYQAVIDADPPAPSLITGTQSRVLPFRSAVESDGLKIHTDANLADTKPNVLAIDAQYLRGDLDNIVLKALKKEPERRYSSAENLAEDIHRHQRGLTVTARPDVFSYRAAKFINRNRTSVIAVCLLLLAVVAGIIATVWQARIAQIERDRAKLEAEKVRKINNYTQNILNFSNPHWLSSNPKRNRDAKISDALDEALKNIDTDLANEPEIQAELLFTLGQTYLGQGQSDKAEKLLRQAIEKFNLVFGEGNLRAMQTSVILGDTLYIAGKLDEADIFYTNAINYFRPKVVEDTSQNKWLAIALNDLGNVYGNRGKFKESQALVRESVEIAENITGRDRYVLPVVKSNLGTHLGQTGDFQEALKYFNNALEDMRAAGNEQTLEGGSTYYNIGRMYTALDDYKTAEYNYEKAREILTNSGGEEHFYTLQNNLHTATNYYKQERYGEAKALIERTLKIQDKIYPNGHYTIAFSRRLLGSIYTKTGLVREGEDQIRQALKMIFQTFKEPNQEISLVKTALAENLIVQKRFAEAKEILSSALDGYVKTKGEDHPATRQCRELLSKL
ncbi:MAG TPA: serine/threonine-protein kinase [Pyrinomonadaceae bacterium]|nr:serine/threonine-protein kinase [Pyrinomonadaceae bacterium]